MTQTVYLTGVIGTHQHDALVGVGSVDMWDCSTQILIRERLEN